MRRAALVHFHIETKSRGTELELPLVHKSRDDRRGTKSIRFERSFYHCALVSAAVPRRARYKVVVRRAALVHRVVQLLDPACLWLKVQGFYLT